MVVSSYFRSAGHDHATSNINFSSTGKPLKWDSPGISIDRNTICSVKTLIVMVSASLKVVPNRFCREGRRVIITI